MGKSSQTSQEKQTSSQSSNLQQNLEYIEADAPLYYMDAEKATEYLQLYGEVESLLPQQLSKKCFALEIQWFQKFKKFAHSLASIQEQIKQNVKPGFLGGLNGFGDHEVVEVKGHYPGPIMNFSLVELEGPYTTQLYKLDENQAQQWKDQFSDWSLMKLRSSDQIQRDKDFLIVSQTVWIKLIRYFGGGPEIGFFLIDKKLMNQEQIDISLGVFQKDSFEIKELPDLQPISLQIFNVDNQGPNINFKAVLVSRYIGVKNFLNSISSQFEIAPTKVSLYKTWVDRSGTSEEIQYELIQTKGASTKRLVDFDLDGIQMDADGEYKYKLFLQTNSDGINNHPNKGTSQLDLHKCMRHLLNCNNIHKNNQDGELASQDEYFMDLEEMDRKKSYSPDNKRQGNRRNGQLGINLQAANLAPQTFGGPAIPEEYASDPDLYYAIQASLNDNQQATETLTGWDHINQNFGQQNQSFIPGGAFGGKQKTPSTNDNFSAKNNQSMEMLNDGFDIDSEDPLAVYGSNNRQRNNTPRIIISALEGNENKQGNQGRHSQPTRQEKMKQLRVEKLQQFQQMRDRARNEMKPQGIFNNSHSSNQSISYSKSIMGNMGPIKSFAELQDSILKLRENFDSVILGKVYKGNNTSKDVDMMDLDMKDCSPLKKKDLNEQFRKSSDMDGCMIIGGGTALMKDQECETDEEEEMEQVEKIKDTTQATTNNLIQQQQQQLLKQNQI
eukprot:403348921